MKIRNALLSGLIGIVAVVGCSDTPEVGDEGVSSLPDADDVQQVVSDIQTEVSDIAAEVESSEASEELRSAWDDLQTEISAAVDSVTADDELDRTAIEEGFEDFESELEALGDDVSDELRSSWTELRERLEQLMS